MTDQVWYSSKSANDMLFINSVIAFQDLDTDQWVFDDKKELYSFKDKTTRQYEDEFVQFGCSQG